MVVEDSALPSEELNPPSPEKFQPDPYVTNSANVLLLTSPSGIFHRYKKTDPEKFLTVARSELNTLLKITKSTSFLDMDLPISSKDIADGLFDEKGRL